jgi:hypothetical protein
MTNLAGHCAISRCLTALFDTAIASSLCTSPRLEKCINHTCQKPDVFFSFKTKKFCQKRKDCGDQQNLRHCDSQQQMHTRIRNSTLEAPLCQDIENKRQARRG